jgi:fatty-acyl-CoA synthase
MSGAGAGGALHGSSRYADSILTALARRPYEIAFRWEEAGTPRRLTYAETLELIWRQATLLREIGLRPGDGIALLARNRPEAFTLMAASCLCRLRYVPLHPLGSPAADEYTFADADIRALFVDADQFGARAAAAEGRVEIVRDLGEVELPTARPEKVLAGADADGPAALYILYTGGTTGSPKGVMLPDRSLTTNAWMTATHWDWPAHADMAIGTPMSHAAGLFVLPGLMRGATFTLQPRFDVPRLLDAIENDGVNSFFAVPSMLYDLLDHPATAAADLSALQWVLYGAAPMSPRRLEEAIDAIGPVLNQAYGQAEAPNTVFALSQDDHARRDPVDLGSCGRLLAGVETALLDPEENPVAADGAGEICIRGPLVMDGYWGKSEQTAEALRGGWLHTGDVARRNPSGTVTIVDRLKDMVISGGFNIYPREIEDVLTRHPGVAAAAVYGLPDARWGEAVTAAVVARPGQAPDAEELVAMVRTAKGSVATPKHLVFLDELPLTPVGKPDKKALRGAGLPGAGADGR